MLKDFAKENVCKCLFYIKSRKVSAVSGFVLLAVGSGFLRTNHEQVLLEVERPKFLTPLDLHSTAQGIPVIGHVGATMQPMYLCLAV